MAGKSYMAVCLACMLCTRGMAQIWLPMVDLEVKASQNVIPANNVNLISLRVMETTNLFLAAHVQINQYLAAGWIYSRSFRGQGYNSPNDFKFHFGRGDSRAITLMQGPEIRISAGRSAKWRPYLNLNYCVAQVVEDKGSYRFASKQTALGASIGLMRRLGNRLYFNVLELGMKRFSEKIFWADTKLLLEAKTGFTYNIGKRK